MTPTGEQLGDYLSGLSSNMSDLGRYLALLIVVAIWVGIIVLLRRGDNFNGFFSKKIIIDKKKSVNVEPEEHKSSSLSAGPKKIISQLNNIDKKMDMNPINEGTDTFVPKYKNPDASNASETKISVKYDPATEVNALANVMAKNDKVAVFAHIKRITAKGISIDSLAENAILEFDKVLASKVTGEPNRSNLILSQIIANWNKEKIESVIGGFIAMLDSPYSDPAVGAKVSILKMMRG